MSVRFLCLVLLVSVIEGFTIPCTSPKANIAGAIPNADATTYFTRTSASYESLAWTSQARYLSVLFSESEITSTSSQAAPVEVIGRRIVVKGDVNGGYIRTCVRNEAARFRKLVGTMSPPDDDIDTAEIYVEGKVKNVEGFIRWCKKGSQKIGLSQKFEVQEINEEEPTGLYDDFYVKTGREENK